MKIPLSVTLTFIPPQEGRHDWLTPFEADALVHYILDGDEAILSIAQARMQNGTPKALPYFGMYVEEGQGYKAIKTTLEMLLAYNVDLDYLHNQLLVAIKHNVLALTGGKRYRQITIGLAAMSQKAPAATLEIPFACTPETLREHLLHLAAIETCNALGLPLETEGLP